MPSMRRRRPEPPAGMPAVEHRPGLADEMLRELAPLLAEEGINLNDPDGIDAPDMETLQRALNRAVERQNLARFTPVGVARDLAAATLRRAVVAITDGDAAEATSVLDAAQPDSPDNSVATVAGCIGLALGLLDDWLGGHDTTAPAGLARHTRLPAGHWDGERAAADVLRLAGKHRAFRSLDSLIVHQGSLRLLYGCALALTAALTAWSDHTDTPLPELIHDAIG